MDETRWMTNSTGVLTASSLVHNYRSSVLVGIQCITLLYSSIIRHYIDSGKAPRND